MQKSQSRLIELDFFRGLVLLIIVVDHIGGSILSRVTLHAYALCDAAEVFVFLGGFATATAYAALAERRNEATARSRFLRRSLEIYRAFPANEDAGSANRGPNPTPVVIATGEKSPFAGLAPKMVDDLRNQGFANAEAVSIPGAVHYVVEDSPKAVAELIATHAKRASDGANR